MAKLKCHWVFVSFLLLHGHGLKGSFLEVLALDVLDHRVRQPVKLLLSLGFLAQALIPHRQVG
jgi:hypothetical protein